MSCSFAAAEARATRGPMAAGRVAVLLAGLFALPALPAGPPPDTPRGHVVAVIDGDTVVVRTGGREERVRLLGIDAPELHDSEKLAREVARSGRSPDAIQQLGAAARRALADLVADRTVTIERDVEERDRYQRLLAWVWRDDGRLVNEEIVREGWAKTLTIPPNVRHIARLRAAQAEARAARRGLWTTSALAGNDDPAPPRPRPAARDCPVERPIKGNRRDRPVPRCIYHLPGSRSYAETIPEQCFASETEARAAGCRPARR